MNRTEEERELAALDEEFARRKIEIHRKFTAQAQGGAVTVPLAESNLPPTPTNASSAFTFPKSASAPGAPSDASEPQSLADAQFAAMRRRRSRRDVFFLFCMLGLMVSLVFIGRAAISFTPDQTTETNFISARIEEVALPPACGDSATGTAICSACCCEASH